MQSMGVAGVNPMASLGTSPGAMGTLATLNPMSGVSAADPLSQSYSSVSPYAGKREKGWRSMYMFNPFPPRGSPLTSKIIWC